MSDIAEKAIVLKLNKSWVVIEVAVVQKVIVDLVTGTVNALDINYVVRDDGTPDTSKYEYVNPVTWDEWITLPIRPFDLAIHSARLTIRVPTVVIASNYNKIPTKKYKGKPTREALFYRDNGRDIYTGESLKFEDSTIDHILPLSRGGKDVFENTGLTTRRINNTKGNKLNSEIGLEPKFVPSAPKEIPVHKTIRHAKHPDWKFFLDVN